MKYFMVVVGLLTAVAAGLTFVENLPVESAVLRGAAAGLGVLTVIFALLLKTESNSGTIEEMGDVAEPTPAPEIEAIKPNIVRPSESQPSHAQAVQLLTLLQEKGRFLDFIMDDVTPFSDAQVGAAARVIHQGCASVVKEYFAVRSVHDAAENSPVSLEPGFSTGDYRLTGKVSGEPPFNGILKHKGWRAENISLPRLVVKEGDSLESAVIAPAEVEIK